MNMIMYVGLPRPLRTSRPIARTSVAYTARMDPDPSDDVRNDGAILSDMMLNTRPDEKDGSSGVTDTVHHMYTSLSVASWLVRY